MGGLGNTISSCSFIGNIGSAIQLNTGTLNNDITKCNIVGNDGAANCGVKNNSGNPATILPSFWGSATGPGADPADESCSATVTTSPAAAKEVKVKLGGIK